MTGAGFIRLDPLAVNTIKEALLFLVSRINQYGEHKKGIVDKVHHPIIDSEVAKQIHKVKRVEKWLENEGRRFHIIVRDEQTRQMLMDVIRSALEIYLKDTEEAKAKSGIPEFDSRIEEITRVASLDFVRKGRSDLYTEYYESRPADNKMEVFLSYSHNDRVLAGKIAAFLRGHEIDVFLAHEDIEISEEWREEISRHLRSCDILLALLTTSFELSVWTNQETGYMLGREAKVIPLIVEGADIKKFGFLEAIQGILLETDGSDASFNGILTAIRKWRAQRDNSPPKE